MMKLKAIVIVSLLVLCILFSFKQHAENRAEVFLSMDFKNKVTLYNTTNKQKVLTRLGHNFKAEDYLLFSIYKTNDSMYYVEASYAIAGKKTKGWISKKTKLAVFAKARSQKLVLYRSHSKSSTKLSVDYTPGELEVVDCHAQWLKLRVKAKNKILIGWLPPEEQCSNPYTTCN
jgi:hypothetical protein